jgi:protein involved in polysaccharide export with SLBB domain
MIRTRARLLLVAVLLTAPCLCVAQDEPPPPTQLSRDDYIVGISGDLEIQIHVWGEVKKPGLYQVPDGTDLLEVLSAAGGPTEYANLSKVRVTRKAVEDRAAGVIRYDLSDYLDDPALLAPPTLRPGDVVRIPRNTKFAWREGVRIVAEIASVITAVYIITKIE